MNENSKKNLRRASNVSSGLLILFTLGVTGAAAAMRQIIPMLMDKDSAQYDAVGSIVMFLVQYLVLIPVLMALFRLTKCGKETAPVRSLFRKPEKSWFWVLRWVVIILGLTYMATMLGTVLIKLFGAVTGFEPHIITMDQSGSLLGTLSNIIGAVVLAPLFEEIFFRGTVLNSASRYAGWSVVIANGILFGLWHCNIAQTGLTFVLGCGAAFLMLKTKSIIPSIIVHLSLNTISTVSGILMTRVDQERIAAQDMEYYMSLDPWLIGYLLMTMTIMLLIGAAFLLLLIEFLVWRDSFRLDKPEPEVTERKRFGIYFTAPLTIIVTLLYIGWTVYNAVLA